MEKLNEKINKEYLNGVGRVIYDFENKTRNLEPILINYNEEDDDNYCLITNTISSFRNTFLENLNDYFYYSNNWVNAEFTKIPLSNLIKINLLGLYPKLILSFYDIGLFQLINESDISRIRNFYLNRSELKLDLNKYLAEKVWLNNFLFNHYASHDFKYVIDSYMYNFIMDLIEQSKGKVVFYNVDEIVLLDSDFDYKSFIEPLFNYDVELFDRGYFKDFRNYALVGEEIISVGDESLIDLIKNSDMVTRKEKVIGSLIEKGALTSDNLDHGTYLGFEELCLGYIKSLPLVKNPNVNFAELEYKLLFKQYISMMYKMGINKVEDIEKILNGLHKLFCTLKIEIEEKDLKSLKIEEHYTYYYWNEFNFIEFVEKNIK